MTKTRKLLKALDAAVKFSKLTGKTVHYMVG